MLKIRGLSLFANVGIAEALFDDIGVSIEVANEIDEERARFYSEVYTDTDMVCGDITDAKIFNKVVSKSRERGVNFIIATPPCQGMSEAGKRNRFDERNQLITFTINMIHELKPDFILIENVPTLLKTDIIVNGVTIKIPTYVREELENDYIINNDTLVRAMNHGVPQMRQRNIFLMVKKSFGFNWTFPKQEEPITLKEAIGHLPVLDPFLREGHKLTLEKFPDFESNKKKALSISKWHFPPTHSWKQVNWMLHTPSATSAIYNKIYFPQKTSGVPVKAHHNNYRRMDWNKPSRTITQNNGVISSLCCVHPGRPYKTGSGEELYSDPRVLTIYELFIVSTLPIDWKIPSWAKEGFIRKVIGEGIPPLLIKKILLELIGTLEG